MFIKRIEGKRLDLKIRLLLVASMMVCAAAIVMATSAYMSRTIINLAETFDSQEIRSKAENLNDTLEIYVTQLKSLEITQSVQDYLVPEHGVYSSNASAVYNALSGVATSASDVWGITLIRNADNRYVNSAKRPSSLSHDFLGELYDNYDASYKLGKGSITYNLQVDEGAEVTTFNLYRPVYDSLRIGSNVGVLALRIEIADLQDRYGVVSDSDMTTRLVGSSGITLYASGEGVAEESQFTYTDRLVGRTGSFQIGDTIYIYSRVGNRNLYLVDSLTTSKYTRMIITPIIMIVLIAVLVLMLMVFVADKIIAGVYRPLQRLRDGFHEVGAGNLNVQVSREDCGEDQQELIDGFNSMTHRLSEQMDAIVEKNRQIYRSEMDALQESIKPHFLYNTLECIHWQNVAEGNHKAARMVSALARYYRISLAEGANDVPLEMELQMVENYVTIQNMRFNDPVELRIEDPTDLSKRVILPKITLQPLVENAIVHGIHGKSDGKGWIRISARESADHPGTAVVSVEDSGCEMTEAAIAAINERLYCEEVDPANKVQGVPHASADGSGHGYGVWNVQMRLQLAYGSAYGLHYVLTEGGGTRVDIVVPLDVQPGSPLEE